MSSITSSAGIRHSLGDLLFSLRSCTRYNRLATKLRSSAAYPKKVSVTCANIQLVRSSGDESSADCSPMQAAKVRRNTNGKMKTPGDGVLYFSQKTRKKAMIRK